MAWDFSVAAGSDVVGDGRSRPFIPGHIATGAASYRKGFGTKQGAVVISNEKGAVRPITDKPAIEPALVDHDPGDRQCNRRVSTRLNSKPTIGLDREPNATGIDNDQLGSSRLGICHFRRSRELGGAWVMPPQQYAASPLVIWGADRGPGRENAGIISMPSTDFS